MFFNNIKQFNDLSLNNLNEIVGYFGLEKIVSCIEGKESFGEFGTWEIGQIKALFKLIGNDNARKLVTGEQRYLADGSTGKIVQAERVLFDKNGRCIPYGLQERVCDPTGERIVQPRLDYKTVLSRFNYLTNSQQIISVNEFETRTNQLIDSIKGNKLTRNILKNTHLPIIICQNDKDDLGKIAEKYINIAVKSLKIQKPKTCFGNNYEGELEAMLASVFESRYEELLTAMEKGPIIALLFVDVFMGYSVHAQRECMENLPPGFILGGPVDIGMGIALYPDIFQGFLKNSRLQCSAVQFQSADYSLRYKFDGQSGLMIQGCLSESDGVSSGTLLYIGTSQ